MIPHTVFIQKISYLLYYQVLNILFTTLFIQNVIYAFFVYFYWKHLNEKIIGIKFRRYEISFQLFFQCIQIQTLYIIIYYYNNNTRGSTTTAASLMGLRVKYVIDMWFDQNLKLISTNSKFCLFTILTSRGAMEFTWVLIQKKNLEFIIIIIICLAMWLIELNYDVLVDQHPLHLFGSQEIKQMKETKIVICLKREYLDVMLC